MFLRLVSLDFFAISKQELLLVNANIASVMSVCFFSLSSCSVCTVDGSGPITWLRENKRRGGGVGGIGTVVLFSSPLSCTHRKVGRTVYLISEMIQGSPLSWSRGG